MRIITIFLTCIYTFVFNTSVFGQKKDEVKSQQRYHDIQENASKDTLFIVYANSEAKEQQLGDKAGFINQKGDTVIAIGTYLMTFSEKILNYGFVHDGKNIIGIDSKGNRLFEVFWFDNGPDYVEEGYFRILRDGKIGFADTTGKVVISPQFDCVTHFYEGKTKVGVNCRTVKKDEYDEYPITKADEWYFIDKKGNRIK